jgi:hypothetical protein
MPHYWFDVGMSSVVATTSMITWLCLRLQELLVQVSKREGTGQCQPHVGEKEWGGRQDNAAPMHMPGDVEVRLRVLLAAPAAAPCSGVLPRVDVFGAVASQFSYVGGIPWKINSITYCRTK